MPAGAPRGRTRGHPDRLDEYRFALLSTVPRQASRTGGSLQTGVQGRLAHELQVLFGARSICGMKITGPFGADATLDIAVSGLFGRPQSRGIDLRLTCPATFAGLLGLHVRADVGTAA